MKIKNYLHEKKDLKMFLHILFSSFRGAYLYRRERKKRSHNYSSCTEVGTEAKRTQSSGSRTTSATTGSSEDGSSGQHEDYDTEV